MIQLPPVRSYSAVTAEDRVSAIDFVNRVNWLFDFWDVDALIDAFLPDSVTYHWHGTMRGWDELRRFFDETYPTSSPWSAGTLPIPVDADDDGGVIVRYHNLLVRFAQPEAAPPLSAGQAMESPDDLPAIWIYSTMVDRLRRSDKGWKIL